MKTRVPLKIIIVVVLLAITATTVLAADSPYLTASFWMADPLDPAQPAPSPDTPPDTDVPGWWWRDTASQNALAQHSADEFTGQVDQTTLVYYSTGLKIYVYYAASGSNVTVVTTPHNVLIVGCAGGYEQTLAALQALRNRISGFLHLIWDGVVIPGASQEQRYGCRIWQSAFNNYSAPIYASASYTGALERLELVEQAFAPRQRRALGQSLAWGADGFLGAGSLKEYQPPSDPRYAAPTVLVPAEGTSILVENEAIQLLPTPAPGSGLLVYIPRVRILIGGEGGAYLPEAGSLLEPGAPFQARSEALNQVLSLAPDYYLPSRGQHIVGAQAIQEAVAAQRDALQSIYDQTITLINQGATLDEAAAGVALPADLAANPYNQEFVSTVSAIVKNIYHEKLGWFSGNVVDLTSTLTEAGKAQALMEAFGLENLISAARNAELNARDLPAAEQALYLAAAAYQAAPENFEANQIYAQALRKNAFMQKSAQVRNYYLTVASDLGTFVTDFAITGEEDTQAAFTALTFSQHFYSLAGAALSAVKIASLPDAAAGVLALPGTDPDGNPGLVPVSAGQEIAAADLDGLVFTPAPDWNGSTSFLWNGKDGGSYAVADATVTIALNPVNDSPVLSASPLADVSADEDAAPLSIDLAAGFADVDGDPLVYTVNNGNPDLLEASVDGALLNLALQPNQSGTATLAITASDPGGLSAADEITVTVSPVNDAPWANGQDIKVMAGTTHTVALDYGDLETTQAGLSFQVSGPTYGTLANTAPALTTLYTGNTNDLGISIAIGVDGLPITVFNQYSPRAVKIAHCQDFACTQATINSIDGGFFYKGSLAIGADGLPILSYRDGNLKVAHCNDLACTSVAIATLDSSLYSTLPSIAIGVDGLPVISYLEGYPDYDLKAAHCLDAACSSAKISLVDSAGDVGFGSSITIGADGLPIISYYEELGEAEIIKVAHCSKIDCSETPTITTLAEVGYWTPGSIQVGADGLPLIVYYNYYDPTNDIGELKVAHCNDLACTSASHVTVDSAGDVGEDVSSAIGADGLPVISYLVHRPDYDLKVAHCLDAACSSANISVVDSDGLVGYSPAIAIGKDSLPVISYIEIIALGYNDITVKVAHCQNAACASYPDLPDIVYTAPAGFSGEDSFTYTVTDPQGLSATAEIHFTVINASSIAGIAFDDANGNGSRDDGETGLAGVVIRLQNADGSLTTQETTAEDGSYIFMNLTAGTYNLQQEVLPPGRVPTTPEPVEITLADEQNATGVIFGSVVSADLRVGMTYSVDRKQIVYTITVANDGPAGAVASLLTDPLSDGISFVSVSTTQGTCSGGRSVACDFGDLASGGNITVSLKVNRINTKIPIVNTVRVSSSSFDIDPADNTATVTIP
jgi:uncharacterized repeat protein (TIGR01451 family)